MFETHQGAHAISPNEIDWHTWIIGITTMDGLAEPHLLLLHRTLKLFYCWFHLFWSDILEFII